MTPAVYIPPLPRVRPRFYTHKEMARRGRHRDPAFRCVPVPPLPDYEAIVTEAMRAFWDSGAWVN